MEACGRGSPGSACARFHVATPVCTVTDMTLCPSCPLQPYWHLEGTSDLLQTSFENHRTPGGGAGLGFCSHSLKRLGPVSLTSPPPQPSGQRGRPAPALGMTSPEVMEDPGWGPHHCPQGRHLSAAVSFSVLLFLCKQASCWLSPSLPKDVLLPEMGPLAGRSLPAHRPSQKAGLGTTSITHSHAHSPIHSFTLTHSLLFQAQCRDIQVTK